MEYNTRPFFHFSTHFNTSHPSHGNMSPDNQIIGLIRNHKADSDWSCYAPEDSFWRWKAEFFLAHCAPVIGIRCKKWREPPSHCAHGKYFIHILSPHPAKNSRFSLFVRARISSFHSQHRCGDASLSLKGTMASGMRLCVILYIFIFAPPPRVRCSSSFVLAKFLKTFQQRWPANTQLPLFLSCIAAPEI